jgi:hypothetical protein
VIVLAGHLAAVTIEDHHPSGLGTDTGGRAAATTGGTCGAAFPEPSRSYICRQGGTNAEAQELVDGNT